MEPASIQVDGHYTYKGLNYTVISFCQVKDADAGNWSCGIEYVRFGDDPYSNGSNVYVRTEQDFANKFTPLDCDA